MQQQVPENVSSTGPALRPPSPTSSNTAPMDVDDPIRGSATQPPPRTPHSTSRTPAQFHAGPNPPTNRTPAPHDQTSEAGPSVEPIARALSESFNQTMKDMVSGVGGAVKELFQGLSAEVKELNSSLRLVQDQVKHLSQPSERSQDQQSRGQPHAPRARNSQQASSRSRSKGQPRLRRTEEGLDNSDDSDDADDESQEEVTPRRVGLPKRRTHTMNKFSVSFEFLFLLLIVLRFVKADVQAHFNTLLGRQRRDPIDITKIPRPAEIRAYLPEEGDAVTVDNFRPDFSNPPNSGWNQSVANVFAGDFQASHPAWKVTHDRVAKACRTYIKSLSRRYRTQIAAAKAQQEKLARRDQRKRLVCSDFVSLESPFSIKPKCLHRRIEAAQLYAPHHALMLEYLGVNGMSSDETDPEQGPDKQYNVLVKPWLSASVVTFKRSFDALQRRHRKLGAADNSFQGSRPHLRNITDKTDTTRPPVKRLPANAYNAEWLSKQSNAFKEELDMKANYNFTLEEDLQE